MIDIEKIRSDFPILSRRVYGKPLVYLDNGATAQKPLRVIEKLDYLYRTLNANIHRGVHCLSMESTEEYEAARETVRGFINAAQTAEIVFTSGATASINAVTYSFGEQFIHEGDNIVVSEMEHHSNIVPWQMVCERKGAQIRVLPFDEDGRLEVEKLKNLIDDRTRIVAVTEASNVLGTRPDLQTVVRIAHAAGVPVVVDGCQGIVHGKVDVRAMDYDFYVFSGHKLYGPTGIGVLYGKREWLEKMPPFMGGGDMVDRVSFGGTTFAALPFKFEAGTSNYTAAIGMAEAIKYVELLDMAQVVEHEKHLVDFTTAGLNAIEGLRIYGTQLDKCAIISFTIDGTHPTDVGMVLDKLGIAVRTGTHCAEPVMTHYGITSMCRSSFALYNTIEEADALVKGVERATRMLRG